MAFILSDDQEALRSTVERSFADIATSSFLRSFAETDTGYVKLWELTQSLGLPEYFGDPNSSFTDLTLVSYEAGRCLLPSVVSESLYFGPFTTARCGAYPCKDISKRICVGVFTDATTASFISDSDASFVAVIKPFTHGQKTLSLSPIEKAFLKGHGCLDLTRRSSSMTVEDQRPIADKDAQKILYGFMILVAAELSGVAAKAVSMTREYSLTRKQFGVEIGSFQAVQQQLADAHLKAEGTWALTQFASSVFAQDPEQLPLAARSALSFAVKSVPLICETALQLHGGIGFTWEYDMHLYLRRAQTLASLYALGEDDERAILDDAARL